MAGYKMKSKMGSRVLGKRGIEFGVRDVGGRREFAQRIGLFSQSSP